MVYTKYIYGIYQVYHMFNTDMSFLYRVQGHIEVLSLSAS